VLLLRMATQRRPFDVAGFSISRSARFRGARTLSGRGAPSAGAGAVHAPEFERQLEYGFINSLLRSPGTVAQGCACYPKPVDPHIPVLASRYPRDVSLCLNVSRVVGIAANASRCAWAGIRQGCLGRLEPGRGSGHPARPRNSYQACQGNCGSSPRSVGCTLSKIEDHARPVCIRDAGCLVIASSCLVVLSPPSNFIVFLSPLLNGYLCGAFIFFLCLLPSRSLTPLGPLCIVCNNF
jgi:hypothetical protein